MLWETIKGQAGAVDYLRQAIEKNRVVSTYLFAGPEGVGKALAASVFARALNCRVKPGQGCGDCPDCRQIAAGSHPDMHRLAPASKSRLILADEIREIRKWVYLHSRGDNWKVFLVEEADRMNSAAQNIFLKTLEEPPGKTVLILITSQPGLLLPTIRSRCQKVSFTAWPFSLMEPFLREKLGLAEAESFALQSISGGCPGRALRFHREGVLETRREVIGPLAAGRELSAREVVDLVGLWLDYSARTSRELAAELKKARTKWSEVLTSKQREDLEEQDNARVAAAERAGLEIIFQLIFSWIRDLFLYSALGPSAPLINRDLAERVEGAARRFREPQLRRMLGRVEEGRRLAERAASRPVRQLVLENMLIQLGYWSPGV